MSELTLREEPEGSEWKRILVRLVVAVVVLGAAYVGAAVYLGQHVANGTTVAGVDIGGKTPEAAADHLRNQLEDTATRPVEVQAGEDTVTIAPGRAGLSLDIDATLEGVAGTTYHPGQMWQDLTGDGHSRNLEVTIDTEQLTAALERAAEGFDTEVVEGSVAFENGRVDSTGSTPGRSLDVGTTAEAVEAAWPRQSTITGVVTAHQPELSQDEITRFTEEYAEPAMSGPVRVVIDDQSTNVTTTQLSRLLTVQVGDDDRLSATLDRAGLLEIVRGALPDIEAEPTSATVALGDDAPEVVPGSPGAAIPGDAVLEAVGTALTSDQRTATVETETVEPEITTAEAKDWGVQEPVSTFRSQFPTGEDNEDRTHNIRVGLSHLNGVLVRPGEQFSLLEHLAPFNAEMGYRDAGVIVDGRLTEGMGGGLSQVSTTVFNAAFFAGVQLDAHTPHAYYISRYPEGREATLWNPSIDNAWTNDSEHAILLETWITGDEIVMRFWGTKEYQIESSKGPRRNVEEPEEITDDDPECMTQQPVDGFDVTVTRVFTRGGETVRTQELKTHYNPSDAVTCTHPDAG